MQDVQLIFALDNQMDPIESASGTPPIKVRLIIKATSIYMG